MALTRLFIHEELRPGQVVRLDQEQVRYIGRALRLRPGDALTVFNGESGEFEASLTSIDKTTADVTVRAQLETDAESALKVHLVQGISRGERMDVIVQKATELGVKRISPVLTDHGVVKLDGKRAGKRREHWQKIANSACEQCGRTRPPLIDDPVPLKAWFGAKTDATDVDLILRPGATMSMAALEAPQTKVCLLIGPEGGFSDNEFEDAEVAGFTAVSLGPRILRTETAAIAAVAVVETLWGDLGVSA